MFTGIIEETGIIKEIRKKGDSPGLVIEATAVLEDTRTGDSINTDGVCLTVTKIAGTTFTADVMPETMNRTTFRELNRGSRVNLERALRLGDRLSGHLVSGHIDGTGVIRKIRRDENAYWFTIAAGPEILRYIVEKGSVAVDGISLTVARVDRQTFEVSLIPHTREVTSMMDAREGTKVNIECDMIAKYLEKLVPGGRTPGDLSMEFLGEMGFI
jgi:riboflavin synthase